MAFPPSAQLDHSAFPLLAQIQSTLSRMQQDYQSLSAAVDTINGRINFLSSVKELHDTVAINTSVAVGTVKSSTLTSENPQEDNPSINGEAPDGGKHMVEHTEESASTSIRRPSTTSRIILTTYPGQSGIDPFTMNWGDIDPIRRGPVVVSRNHSTLRRRNGTSFDWVIVLSI